MEALTKRLVQISTLADPLCMKQSEDIVEALLEIKNQYIQFPETEEQIIETRETFELWSALPN